MISPTKFVSPKQPIWSWLFIGGRPFLRFAVVWAYLAVPGSNMGATKMADLKVNGLGWGIGCRYDCNRAKEWGFLEGVLTEYHFFFLS